MGVMLAGDSNAFVAALTFGVQLPHYFTYLGQAAEVQCAVLLINQAAGTDLDHLHSKDRAYQPWSVDCDVA